MSGSLLPEGLHGQTAKLMIELSTYNSPIILSDIWIGDLDKTLSYYRHSLVSISMAILQAKLYIIVKGGIVELRKAGIRNVFDLITAFSAGQLDKLDNLSEKI